MLKKNCLLNYLFLSQAHRRARAVTHPRLSFDAPQRGGHPRLSPDHPPHGGDPSVPPDYHPTPPWRRSPDYHPTTTEAVTRLSPDATLREADRAPMGRSGPPSRYGTLRIIIIIERSLELPPQVQVPLFLPAAGLHAWVLHACGHAWGLHAWGIACMGRGTPLTEHSCAAACVYSRRCRRPPGGYVHPCNMYYARAVASTERSGGATQQRPQRQGHLPRPRPPIDYLPSTPKRKPYGRGQGGGQPPLVPPSRAPHPARRPLPAIASSAAAERHGAARSGRRRRMGGRGGGSTRVAAGREASGGRWQVNGR